ncbi:MAG: crossover junction endodeoxyribonuclease RuvC [Alphaproteobacteria bacterium]|nr:MAG: crossover junction endodeoxyribonuclease RuvC [Alphaproteobacteria bacterium]
MRIFGIDPGLQRTGWGVIDVMGNRLVHVAHGVIKTDPKEETAQRLFRIFAELSASIVKWKPTHAAIEETFMNNNAASALKLGMARGVGMMAPANLGLSVAEYPANLVKKSIVGAGHAEKHQVQMMIKVLLPGIEAAADAADALAVAICHAHHGAMKAKMDAALSGGVR